MHRGRRKLSHERRVLLMALLAGLPGVTATMALLWAGGFSGKVQWTLGLVVVGGWLAFAFAVQENVIRPLQTISNLLAAFREEDFSFRARGTRGDDALAQAMLEVNALADTLRRQRLGALEAAALLRKVMEEIDVAVFAFDDAPRLVLVNRAGERLLDRPSEQLLGRSAEELGLGEPLGAAEPGTGASGTVLDLGLPGEAGRFEARGSTFRQGGLPHRLLVLANVSRALREEERQAWQRLIRVLGHELNNSLAPIKSIAGSLESLLARDPRPGDLDEDLRRGLAVIAARSEALSRFMEAYSRLARLPPPQLQPVDLGALLRRAARLETRLTVAVREGPEVTVRADPDQLEQLLINLLRNAADAALETGGRVEAGWTGPRRRAPYVEVWVQDEGPGLPNTTNLFVPFFTTKPQGSGIGLVLSRQIAEAHGGALSVQNRADRSGCVARLRLAR
jgi:two-component system, NtrC family, nitrogen regulation sensor histidine kinase NtrY